MKHFLFIISFFFSFSLHCQVNILFVGNHKEICFTKDSVEITKAKKLPKDLTIFKSILIFSNAESCFSSSDLVRLEKYLNDGGGVYCGADNWPLLAESQQITMNLYAKECWGNFNVDTTSVKSEKASNQLFSPSDSFPAGKTTVAFPMDYRLRVEVWLDDQPFILTGDYGKGKIVIDCGYSRFYCDVMDETRNGILESIIGYLSSE